MNSVHLSCILEWREIISKGQYSLWLCFHMYRCLVLLLTAAWRLDLAGHKSAMRVKVKGQHRSHSTCTASPCRDFRHAHYYIIMRDSWSRPPSHMHCWLITYAACDNKGTSCQLWYSHKGRGSAVCVCVSGYRGRCRWPCPLQAVGAPCSVSICGWPHRDWHRGQCRPMAWSSPSTPLQVETDLTSGETMPAVSRQTLLLCWDVLPLTGGATHLARLQSCAPPAHPNGPEVRKQYQSDQEIVASVQGCHLHDPDLYSTTVHCWATPIS